MDKKRKRYLAKQRKRAGSRKPRAFGPCDCGCGGEGAVVGPDELFEFLENNRTAADIQAMKDCQRAAAHGDAPAALDAYRRGLHIAGAPQEAMLETLAVLGSLAPPWMLARWIVSQAGGWMLLNQDPRTDGAVHITMACCYTVPQNIEPKSFRELGTSIGACDWVAHQLATFDLGGLADFLDVVIAEQFKARVPMIDEWADAPLQAYRYQEAREGFVRIANVATGERLDVVDRGCLEGSALGAFVLGRVVPAMPGGESMFASRPLEVDERTAREANAMDDSTSLSWLLAIASAFHEGRLGEGVGRRTENVLADYPVANPLAS